MTTMTATKPAFFNGPMGRLELLSYVDPYPGMKDRDRLRNREVSPCVRCGGSGIYSQYHGVCYRCGGNGMEVNGISVGTLRKYAKADAYYRDYAVEYAAFNAAEREREEKAYLAAEVERDHAYALKMNETRDAAVSGFVAEVGASVKGLGLAGEIQVAKTYDASFGFRKATGMFLIIKLDNGQVVKTSGTGASLFQHFERGDRVAIVAGSVKEHAQYEGIDQSVIQRIKLERIETGEDT